MKAVVIVSADGEWAAVRGLLKVVEAQETRLGECFDIFIGGKSVRFFHGGWGRVSASATTQFVIDRLRPDLLVNLGTCGGFEGRIERGTTVLAERTIIYDIVEQMTNADEAIEHYSTRLDLSWLPRVAPTPVVRGLLISGDRDIVATEIPSLIDKHDAVAADWESGAIAWVSKKNGQRLLILRGVSDLVGRAGGEAYGDYELFLGRTRDIMRRLIDALPLWLDAIEGTQASV